MDLINLLSNFTYPFIIFGKVNTTDIIVKLHYIPKNITLNYFYRITFPSIQVIFNVDIMCVTQLFL